MKPKNYTLIIILAVIGLVAAAGVTALILSGGDDGTDEAAATTTDNSVTSDSPAEPAVGETQSVAVVGTPLVELPDSGADPAVGLAMPLIEGHRFDGSAVSIGGPTDRPTMYVFLAHWCPHCNDEIPELIALNDSGGIPAELDVIGISTAVAADRPNYPPSQWVIDKGWPWPVMADDELATSWVTAGGSGFPFTVLADADGNVLARAAGQRPAAEIQRWLDDNLASASA